MTTSQMLKSAQWYLARGLSVIPVKPDKKPFLPSWKKFQAELPDPIQIREWWAKYGEANPGIVTGAVSGVDVVDCDSEQGRDALNEFLPDSFVTPIAKTPKGYHYYFRHRAGLSNGVRVITDCDLRTTGGYVVAPPGANGQGSYKWTEGLGLHEVDPAPMPDVLFDVLQQGSAAMPARQQSYTQEGSRYKAQQKMPQQGITNRNIRNISLEKGSRDDSLFHIANCLYKGGMDSDNIMKCLSIFGSCCKPPFPENELKAKISSVLKRSENRGKNLTAEVREWVSAT